VGFGAFPNALGIPYVGGDSSVHSGIDSFWNDNLHRSLLTEEKAICWKKDREIAKLIDS